MVRLGSEPERHPSVRLMWLSFVILKVVLGVVLLAKSNLVWKWCFCVIKVSVSYFFSLIYAQ